MTALIVVGIIVLIILGLLFPRVIAPLVIGALTGGAWWWLFGSLAIIGLVIELAIWSE